MAFTLTPAQAYQGIIDYTTSYGSGGTYFNTLNSTALGVLDAQLSCVTNCQKFICDDNGYEENIIMCGTDHIINRNLDTMFDEDFDIMIPIRKGTRVNNAMIVVKKVTEDVKRFFGYRYDRWVSDAHKDPHWNWYGDQRTYDNILREELGLLPQRDPPKKFRFL